MPRETLPGRRLTETHRIDHDGQTFHVSVGFYEDGRPGEIFITSPKASQTYAAVQAADAAVAISIAMQYGVPLAVLRDAFLRESDGSPAGILGAAVDLLSGIETAPPGG
jgi:hypothetical protein